MQSILLSHLPKLPVYNTSEITNFCFRTISKLDSIFLGLFDDMGALLHLIPNLPWKIIILSLFIISLPMAAESNLQLSQLTSRNFDTSALNEKQFGIVVFSASNILLIPLVIIFVRQFYSKRIKFSWIGFEFFLIIFMILSEISIIFSTNVQSSLVWYLKFLFSMAVYLIFSRLNFKGRDLKILLYVLLSVVFLEGFLAILQFIKGGLIGLPIENTSRLLVSRILYFPTQGIIQFKALGTLSHPNSLSALLSLLLPIGIISIFGHSSRLRIFGYASIIFAVVSITLTLSRWGLATGLFSIILTLILLVKFANLQLVEIYHRLRIILLIALSIGIFFISNQFIAFRFLHFSDTDVSLKLRLNMLAQSLYTLQNNPYGIGAGTFAIYMSNNDVTVFQLTQRYLYQVHNFYLLVTSELGILSLPVFLFFIAGIVKSFLKRYRVLSFEMKIAAIGLLASVVTFLFSGIWEPRTLADRVGFEFFLLLGLLVNLLHQQEFRQFHK